VIFPALRERFSARVATPRHIDATLPDCPGTPLAIRSRMTLLRLLESWAEGLLRIVIGIGLAWIGVVEGAGYGAFLEVVGAICIAAGIGEIWSVEFAAHCRLHPPVPKSERPRRSSRRPFRPPAAGMQTRPCASPAGSRTRDTAS
jgi:hypothetical protein